ncbi:hypothetical protein F8M41_000370 [Gigaspora margarita]|uniref:Uncharacterized protein n=1 Tax=Gigaspora margarita TaxID=4874 RepID=A0A8H3XGT1_GIGMA|nr:hypothetical protein F8M41_000370 [Gigaspora margarita]
MTVLKRLFQQNKNHKIQSWITGSLRNLPEAAVCSLLLSLSNLSNSILSLSNPPILTIPIWWCSWLPTQSDSSRNFHPGDLRITLLSIQLFMEDFDIIGSSGGPHWLPNNACFPS